ncbi:ATP phosphoribosyltransferase [Bryobacterales bacterium F-183]|nr:ATP phosphoribosyltransferase [Bryobacterales bacterium F-183]
MSQEQIRIGIPKGSLQESTLSLFTRAGYNFHGSERSLWLSSNDPELKPVLLRPQEIPQYVADGSLDCGLSGWDWISESIENHQTGVTEDDFVMLADLCYSKRTFRNIRWVLAVKKDGPFSTLRDLQTAENVRISTELVSITERWLGEKGINAKVAFSWGATEAKVGEFADAIVEATETGASLQANGLKILDTVYTSSTRFFARKSVYAANDWRRAKLDSIALLLEACLRADTKESMRVIAGPNELEVLMKLIPAEVKCTVSPAKDGGGIIDMVLTKLEARDLIPKLAKAGADRITTNPVGILYE